MEWSPTQILIGMKVVKRIATDAISTQEVMIVLNVLPRCDILRPWENAMTHRNVGAMAKEPITIQLEKDARTVKLTVSTAKIVPTVSDVKQTIFLISLPINVSLKQTVEMSTVNLKKTERLKTLPLSNALTVSTIV